MTGMWTFDQNRERLERIEDRLAETDLRADEREDLEVAAGELRAWLANVARLEGRL